jgi:hypothetical protein
MDMGALNGSSADASVDSVKNAAAEKESFVIFTRSLVFWAGNNCAGGRKGVNAAPAPPLVEPDGLACAITL